MTRLRAHYDGKVLVPVDPVDLPTDTLLELDVREISDLPKGSPKLLLKIMAQPPHLDPEVVDELERAIEEGKIPVNYRGAFDDDSR